MTRARTTKVYRKKPVLVEAVQYHGQFSTALAPWLLVAPISCRVDHAIIATPEGDMRADIGDWIIRGADVVYPCKPDVFAATYELVETDEARA